jgi:hypothetical protein
MSKIEVKVEENGSYFFKNPNFFYGGAIGPPLEGPRFFVNFFTGTSRHAKSTLKRV